MSNRTVMLPEVTATASITFTFERLERLEEYFEGAGWYGIIMDAMEPPRPSIIRKVLEIGLDNAEADLVLKHLNVSQVTRKVGDALFLALRGKTLTELEVEQVQAKAQGKAR